jgi:hypothetical protein
MLSSASDAVSVTNKTYIATAGRYGNNLALCSASTGGTATASSYTPIITFTQLSQGSASPRVAVMATVNPLPQASISLAGNAAICEGKTAALTAGGGNTYQWRNANGNITGAINATFVTVNAGTYKVVAISAVGCTDTSAGVTLAVSPLPVVNLGNDTSFCAGNTLTLNVNNSGAAYLWDDATTGQTRVISNTGTYFVTVTTASACVKTDTIKVTVNPSPTVHLGADTFVCAGTVYSMNAGNAGASYLWDNNATTQARIVSTSGTYHVKVTNGYNCVARDTIVATFLTTPVVNLGNDIDACAGNTITLNAGNTENTVLWDNGSTQQTRNVTTSGIYSVLVKNVANCIGHDTVQVNIHALPIVHLGNDTIICHGKTLLLNAGNTGSTYLWNDNSNAQALQVNASGNYAVHVINAYNCENSDDINVTVRPLPSGNINAVFGDTATYTFHVLNAQNVAGYIWDFGDGTLSTIATIVQHRYLQNGQYTVTVTLQGECSDSVVYAITVNVYDVISTGIHAITGDKESQLYPNPARDKIVIENVKGLDLKQIMVYNVIGQQVYNEKADTPMKHKIDIAMLASGMYTARIETSGGTVVRKFEVLR